MINQIHNMDCLEGMKLLRDKSVDMILCDLPYGVTQNKWDVIIPFDEMWKQYQRIIKDNGAIVLTAIQPFSSQIIMSNPKLFRYEWIWRKNKATGHLNSKRMPLKEHEHILLFYKKLPTYNPQGLTKKDHPTIRKGGRGNGNNYGKSDKDSLQEFENYPKSLLSFPMDANTFHPTQKPVALFEYLIRTYTNEGETVLDNCMGSGTTAVAAINTNRNFIGFEISEEYCAAANQRIDNLQQVLQVI